VFYGGADRPGGFSSRILIETGVKTIIMDPRRPMNTRTNRAPIIVDAVLVMETRDSNVGLRTQAFAGGWSRLYQAGDYYLDLSFKAEPKNAVLIGRLLPSTPQERLEGRVELRPVTGGEGLETPLEASGEFRFECNASGEHALMVDLQGTTLRVQPIEMN
jgi:hypothetical protein